MEDKFVCGNFRLTFLGEDILRVERKYRGAFCDGNTFFVPDRASLSAPPPPCSWEGDVLCFGEYELYLPTGNTLRGLRIERNGRPVYRYRRLQNSGELPPPQKTPEIFALADSPRILLPEGGYSAKKKGKYLICERVEDVYLLFARGSAKRLRALYVALTGRCELVRLSTLGSWNSKYYAYTEREAKQLILDYERHGVPLDVMVIDTDWRKSENGMGYTVNRALFPNLSRFFAFAHSHNVEVVFNDHPEPVRGAKIFDAREIAYREKHLRKLLSMGLDAWWYDRNWIRHLNPPTASVARDTFGLYLYYDVTSRFFAERGEGAAFRRPVVMGNVVNVENGNYRSISDSASHRYSVQWTGDIDSTSYALAQEVENLVRCGENCIPYMNSDCGGHTGNPDKEEFIRWMQYGVLSPVFRPHCTKTVKKTREPWLYDGETLDIVREYVKLRSRLMPYLYALAREAYDTGIPMFRSLALEYPSDRRACAVRNEYLLGKNILVAPVCGKPPRPLEEENYTAPVEITFYRGTRCEGAPVASVVRSALSLDLHGDPPAEGVPPYWFSAKVRTKIRLGRAERLYLRTDDGATVYLDGTCVLRDESTHAATFFALADLTPDAEHTLEIEYFQAEGEAFLGLYTAEPPEGAGRKVYLPAGRWLDVFGGAVYAGGRTVVTKCSLRAMPLFVRLGALLPLAEGAQTVKEQSFAHIIYDFYPDPLSSDEGTLYEDDGETTAYRSGAFRRSGYAAEYLPAERAYLLRFDGAEGSFSGPRAFSRRRLTVRYHAVKGAGKVAHVLFGGAEIPFRKCAEEDAFPFGTEGGARGGDVYVVDFVTDVGTPCTLKWVTEP